MIVNIKQIGYIEFWDTIDANKALTVEIEIDAEGNKKQVKIQDNLEMGFVWDNGGFLTPLEEVISDMIDKDVEIVDTYALERGVYEYAEGVLSGCRKYNGFFTVGIECKEMEE